jgi:hypothetical protein
MDEHQGELELRQTPESQASMEEVAWRRAQALDRPVVVVGFTASGEGRLLDVTETEDGELGLVDRGAYPFDPSPSPAA